ncbi:hypothetical protein VNO77_33452 [Canavalia gladiata]|uniref:Uncharacterized protein n=1 Tax=Canavalia gladiata TaxID=3824 RepID=A0AAN9KCF9_CANGL
MASSKIHFLFILATVLSFANINEAQIEPIYAGMNCSSSKSTIDSGFQINLRTLLSSLSDNAVGDTQFYNNTINGDTPSDSVYGSFMCRGDLLSHLCKLCVQNATQRLLTYCPLSQEIIIWYDKCTVRFSNRYFFSIMDIDSRTGIYTIPSASNPENFMHLLFKTMNDTAEEAARGGIGEKKYATREAKVSEFQTLYCLAQCTPDLSPLHCRTCLNQAIGDLPWCCQGKIGGYVLYPSCNVMFQFYPFYRPPLSPIPLPTLFSPTNTSQDADSKFSQHPLYLSHNCSTNQTFAANHTFQIYVTTLLSYLSFNATIGNKFHKADVAGKVFGLFMCRGDLPSGLCAQCIQNATYRISSECRSVPEAIIWYTHCMLRYSYRNIFYHVDTIPMYSNLNITATSNPNLIYTLSNTLTQLAFDIYYKQVRYGTKSLKLNHFQTLYTLVQCTPDLSNLECSGCLEHVIGFAIPWSRLGSVGGRVLYPSCNLRFELFQFYMDDHQAQPIHPISPTDSQRQKMLSWFERYIIIEGIAKGILYLHEDSRLKVIHRDLKPSNVLLDENMIPKISDFGLARIVELNEDPGSTSRIVGTYGYMSPEYAMFGQFSEKSDIFSFGVMILEIISGKKNLSSYELNRVMDGLLSYVWKQWKNQTPLSILDPAITENYSEVEVLKCIQIGLLCVQQNPDDRPTMTTIVSYMSMQSIELPYPQEPAFFLRARTNPEAIIQESSCSQSINSSTLLSNNDMPTSEFLPR